MNKREFVIGGAAAAMAALTESAHAADAARVAPLSTLGRLPDLAASPDLAAWRAYAGSVFKTHERQAPRLLVLDSVREVTRDRHTEQFTLAFRCADGRALEGGLYTLRHSNGQRVMVYLMPSAAPHGGTVAHFNRLI